MAQALVERLKGILSSKQDDYFDPSDLLDYLNEGYKSVVSTAIKTELQQPQTGGRSIRALDSLRHNQPVTITPDDTYREFPIATIDLDGLVQNVLFEKELYIGVSCVALSEIRAAQKHKWDFGQLKPTQQQGYYEFTTGNILTFYFYDNKEYNGVISFIAKPTLMTSTSESLPELPDRLIHAVVTRAALMAGTQEIRENRGDYQSIYQGELTEHLW